MSEEKRAQLTIQALGRASYLGQLYDATSSTLISGFRLFLEKDIKPVTIRQEVKNTRNTYDEVNSVMARANSLGIDASLSLSIMGGAITVGGMGSYLDSKTSNSESLSVASVVRIRTVHETMDVNQVRHLQKLTKDDIDMLHATHVVTSIAYGGHVMGTVTQTRDVSTSQTDVHGKFTLEVFKGMGKAFGASGEAELTSKEKEEINKFNLSVRLEGDFQRKDEKVPMNAPDLLAVMKKATSFIDGDGVPCEITLTPLAWFQSSVPTFHDLDDADIKALASLYDRIITLERNREWLSSSVEAQGTVFPTFNASCRESSARVADLVSRARADLRNFLKAFRSAEAYEKQPVTFHKEVATRFAQELTQYEADRELWASMMEWVRAGKEHGFPIVSVSGLQTKMNRQDKSAVAVVLIPASVRFTNLLNTYSVLGDDIRKWRSTLDGTPANPPPPGAPAPAPAPGSSQTDYVTLFADPVLDAQLLKLDDKTASLAQALQIARASNDVAFLTYGLSRDGLARLEWNVLNQEGWGILVSQDEGWRYIGDVRAGAPHGSGVITYADKSTYSGTWVHGKRDGKGRLFPAGMKDGEAGVDCVFVDNLQAHDGVVVPVTVYRNGAPVRFERVALRAGNAVMAHVDKLAGLLGWQLGQKFRLRLESTTKVFPAVDVRVNGSHVDPSENPQVAFSPWPLDSAGEKKLSVYPL
ncbi:hypothetical protein PsYK624_088120 [Phanerochaete sordida]|uniref:SNTX MACPF/CDC-like domain-containing protein n=1 Tax=Phanerochaete sordida TaxID=48140 RepID=A0A9P3GDE6_9APHY|nr:hypothetical protein PsYK624_088120 [Phanerochaete sordida]